MWAHVAVHERRHLNQCGSYRRQPSGRARYQCRAAQARKPVHAFPGRDEDPFRLGASRTHNASTWHDHPRHGIISSSYQAKSPYTHDLDHALRAAARRDLCWPSPWNSVKQLNNRRPCNGLPAMIGPLICSH